MSRLLTLAVLLPTAALAEDVTGSDKMLCAPTTVRLCFETGDCYPALPKDLNMAEFLLIDAKAKTVSTTEASGLARSAKIPGFNREDGVMALQGLQDGRAFSIVIHEATGLLTASIAHDGYSVSAFGHCTIAD